MKILCESIHHYVQMIKGGRRFSLAGLSDAEWYCIMGLRVGERTAAGQVISERHGVLLLDVIRRRRQDPRFLFAVPKVLWTLPHFADGQIDWFLGRENIWIEAYERDMVTDDLARDAGLYPLVACCRNRVPSVVIGPAPLRVMQSHLRLQGFVEISTPNLHLEDGGIDRAAEEAAAIPGGRSMLFLVSAGVSAAVIIDRLHDRLPHCWFFDCGSIWDAFAGIGGQRQWRADLYADPGRLERWKRECLSGRRQK